LSKTRITITNIYFGRTSAACTIIFARAVLLPTHSYSNVAHLQLCVADLAIPKKCFFG